MPTIGDTPAGAWMLEMVENCCISQDGQDAIDVRMMIKMCDAEPKSAQIVLQLYASGLTEKLGDISVKDAPPELAGERLIVGTLYMAYLISQIQGSGLPESVVSERLKPIRDLHPIIGECFKWVMDYNGLS